MAFEVININPVVSNINERVLGIDLSFNNPGIFKPIYVSDQQALANLKNLLLTIPGERIENVEFGCELMNAIFEPNTDDLKTFISDIIFGAVSYWLPYINITNLDIKSIVDDPNLEYVVEIYVTFTVNGFSTQTISIQLAENGLVTVNQE